MRFRWLRKPVLCRPTALELMKARERGGRERVEVSLDLGRSIHTCIIDEDGVWVGDKRVSWDTLELIAGRGRDIFYLEGGEALPASIASTHFYKLVLVKWGRPPTLEIDGIHMHRVKDVTPDEDAAMKVRLLGNLRCKSVLDTCMGLGYTAIEVLRKGACRVTTFEVDENVVKLASLNPWSRELEDERVEVVLDDVFESLTQYREKFDAAVHDPPRISLAGQLYGQEFYNRLAQALKPGAKIVHYVGQPGIKRGRRVWRGIIERMRAAGFQVKYDPKTRCVYGRRL